MVSETDLGLADGRTLHVYDTGPADARLTVLWHHGTPNTGAPPTPLLQAAAARGLRWVSYDRPGYGGSTPRPGRSVGAAAADACAVADALGLSRFAVMGHSGGGPHALACAALAPERVVAVVCGAGLAPYPAPGLDWFAGMYPAGAAELRAALAGRATLAAHLAHAGFDPEMFTPADEAALTGRWAWLAEIAGQAIEGGPDAMIDDDLAYVAPWGFDPAVVRAPTLVLQGEADRVVPAAHAAWLAARIPGAELRLRPGEGHVSVLGDAEAALDWLAAGGGAR